MAVFQLPTSGTLLYPDWVQAIYAFTEWLIGTGLFVETASSDGSGGPVESAADLLPQWSYRILHATNNRGGVAFQHAAAGTTSTNGRNWYIHVCRPGDTLSIGGDATHIPAATNGANLVGTGTPASPVGALLSQNLSGSLGTDGNTHVYFTAGDEFDDHIHWQLFVLRFGDISQALGRFPTVSTLPYDSEERAIYKTAKIDARFFRADGTWYESPNSSGIGTISSSASANYLTPVIYGAGGVIKGPSPYFLRSQSGTGLFLVAGVGYYYSFEGNTFFLGESLPTVYNATLSANPTYVVSYAAGAPVPETRVEPTVTVISHNLDGGVYKIRKSDNIVVRVQDETRLWEVTLSVRYPGGGTEEVLFNEAFRPQFKDSTQVVESTTSRLITVKRVGGWPASPTFDITPVDANL